MGYRFADNPPKPEDMLPRFAVRNGATVRISFGCYYLRSHDRKLHDHIGWPYPTHPDAICQEAFNMNLYHGNTADLEEIHLEEEGYDSFDIVFDDWDDIESYIDGWISLDNEDDNIIRMRITATFPAFEDKPKEHRFTVFAGKEGNDNFRDAVCRGILVVLPGTVSN